MESNVDAAEWKLEVERVLPLLKVHIRTDNKVMLLKFGENVAQKQLQIVVFDCVTRRNRKGEHHVTVQSISC